MPEVTSQPGGDGTSKGGGPKQSTDRTAKGFEPTQQEQDVVKGYRERIERARTAPAYKDWVDNLKLWREYVTGTAHKDKTGQKLTRTNMIFATIAASIPEIYAKNPDIAVTPTDAVPESNMANVKKFASTGERVLHKMLVVEGRLKKRSKANIRATSVASYGVLKMVYQSEYRGDPLILHRIEDSQDNLAKLDALVEKKDEDQDPAQLAKQRDEEKANLKTLQEHKEVRLFKGFAVDRLKSEDFLILDDNIAEFDEYVDARALDQCTWMTVDQAKQIFRMEMTGATKYGRPRTDQTSTMPGAENTPAGEMFVCVHEIWDKENGVVRTWVQGMNRWAREPYVPKNLPQRWYPFYVLGFNVVEGRWRPISDVELLAGLQDEYNTTRTNYADVREKAVPKTIIRKGGNLSEVDVKNIMNSDNKDYVAVEGNPATPISQDIMRLDGAQIDPQAYDVTVIRNDMDLVVGRSDASRANLIKPKTATEAEIMQEAMSTRTAERRDTNEDLMSDMATSALEITLGDLTKKEVQQIAGEDCEWPDAPESVEDIFRQVVVRVRAGSTGKPNQAQERDSWGKLLPQITDAMKMVGELRQQGMYEQADAVVELLKETLRRFDEHLDLDAIIPPVKKDENGQPIAQQQAAAELVQVKQQLEECKQQFEQCQQQIHQAKAQEQAKVAQIEADKQAKVAQAGVDTVRETAIAEREKAKAEGDAAFNKWKALLDASVKVVTSTLTATITANAKDPEAQEREAKVALSDERMNSVLKDLTTTMERLGSAFDRAHQQPQKGAGA